MAREDQVIDRNNTPKLLSRLREAGAAEIRVGILGDTASEQVGDGLTMAGLGAVHEFGTDRAGKNHNVVIPERSHLRATWDDRAVMRNTVKRLNQVYAMAGSVGQIMLMTAIVLADAVKEKIDRGISPELNEKYQARRGSGTTPLVGTGRYRNSIQGQVISGNEAR